MSAEVESSQVDSGLTAEKNQNKSEAQREQPGQRGSDKPLQGGSEADRSPADTHRKCKENDKENDQSGDADAAVEAVKRTVVEAPPPKVNPWTKRTTGRVAINTISSQDKGEGGTGGPGGGFTSYTLQGSRFKLCTMFGRSGSRSWARCCCGLWQLLCGGGSSWTHPGLSHLGPGSFPTLPRAHIRLSARCWGVAGCHVRPIPPLPLLGSLPEHHVLIADNCYFFSLRAPTSSPPPTPSSTQELIGVKCSTWGWGGYSREVLC